MHFNWLKISKFVYVKRKTDLYDENWVIIAVLCKIIISENAKTEF